MNKNVNRYFLTLLVFISKNSLSCEYRQRLYGINGMVHSCIFCDSNHEIARMQQEEKQ